MGLSIGSGELAYTLKEEPDEFPGLTELGL